jgi:uncharacterized membrane-anchored protein YitT (DUF2179 family)
MVRKFDFFKNKLKGFETMFTGKRSSNIAQALFGAAVSSFALNQIHLRCNLAEGGSIGLALMAYR